MKRPGARTLVVGAVCLAAAAAVLLFVEMRPRKITVDYPAEGSVFPPEFPAPTFLWRDASKNANTWTIELASGGAAQPAIRATSQGERLRIGEIDPRCVGPTN